MTTSRIYLLITLFGIVVIIAAALAGIFFKADLFVAPEVEPAILEEVRPVINQSFVGDLQERSVNSAGIDLEL